MAVPETAPNVSTSPFLAACRGEPHDRVPVWFMRQAGRSLPEYRAIRDRHSFVEVVHDPELTAEVTLQPVRRHGVDAAILFSDIVTPLQAIGVDIELTKGVGPTMTDPIRRAEDLDVLRPIEPDVDAPYVLDAIRLLARELDDTPLIGFAGAPFTLASYLVEGRPSRDWVHTKSLMYGDETTWHDLLGRLADIVLAHLRAQVDAGAAAIQLFDSWAGSALSRDDYDRYVLPHSRRVLEGLADLDVPRIHFGVNSGELLASMAAAGADVVGVDWRLSLAEARRRLPAGVGTQGNLDPAAVLAPEAVLDARIDAVLESSGHRPDHVFNLGHGVLPALDPGALTHVVEYVHEHGRADGGVAAA